MSNKAFNQTHRTGARCRALRAAVRRRLAAQAGFTLLEVLVAATLSIVVVGGPLAFIIVSINQQNGASSRTVAAQQAEIGLERLARDLRSAIQLTAVSGTPLGVTVSSSGTPKVTQIAFSIPTPNAVTTAQSVTWRCTDGGSCTRQLGSAAAASEITGVTSTTLTTSSGAALALPATNPDYIGITLNLQVTSQLGLNGVARGASNPIVVQTGIDLRNFA